MKWGTHKNRFVSDALIRRLPRYFRFFSQLQEEGVARISSNEMSQKIGFTASQIRQDFNCFGGFGQQGYGYNVIHLKESIASILGLEAGYKTILIGAGNLGRAVVAHIDFESYGFHLIGIFDKKESVAGHLVRGLPVRPEENLDEFCRERLPETAVICVSGEEAPSLCEQLVRLGIKAFWNFSHFDVAGAFPALAVETVRLDDSLMNLCYKLNQ